MKGSQQRNAVYERKLELFSIKDGRATLSAFSDTRRTVQAESLNGTINTLPALIASLEELKLFDITCEGLLNIITSFDFLLKLLILRECFEFLRYASGYLPKEEVDLVTAVDAERGKNGQFCTHRGSQSNRIS